MAHVGAPRIARCEQWFIPTEKAHHAITILCRCLHVTRSGFYAWQRRPGSQHARRDRQLRVLVPASHEGSRRSYGSPRVWAISSTTERR